MELEPGHPTTNCPDEAIRMSVADIRRALDGFLYHKGDHEPGDKLDRSEEGDDGWKLLVVMATTALHLLFASNSPHLSGHVFELLKDVYRLEPTLGSDDKIHAVFAPPVSFVVHD